MHREPERPQRCVALDEVEGGHAEGLVRGRIGVGGQQHLGGPVAEIEPALAKLLVSESAMSAWTKVYYAGGIWPTTLRS